MASWVKFFTYAVNAHPCLNDATVTIISDKDKGFAAPNKRGRPKGMARIPRPNEKSSWKKRKVMDKKGLETVVESLTAEDDAP